VHRVLCIVKYCSEALDHSVRTLSITVVLGPDGFGVHKLVGALGGSQISTGREDSAGGSAVPSMLSEGLVSELSDFEAEDVTLKGDYLEQVVEFVIAGVPTVLEVCFMCFLLSLTIILL